MSYVTGISGNVISAASAGFAPTNSAEVSAIASAYATGGAQVVTSLQYATSESATVASTVTADTAVGYGARDISAEYYDYGYSPWTDYNSSKPLVQVRMTAVGNMTNYSSNPYYLYVVPYGATNDGNVSTTSQLTDALSFGEFSGGMNDLIVAEGTGSANSQDPYVVEVNFDVTHVPFIGSEPAYWGTVEGSYAVVDNNEYTRPVFCVAGGYDGSQLFEVRGNTTAELDFGAMVAVSAVSGINELDIYTTGGGGADTSAVSAIASAYANSAVSSKADSSALSSYVPYSSLEYNTASAISGINGSALAAGSTYSAGEGIDITDDIISVETPVDIVAGPGIVIDNPDGNTLRVSQAANYEVALWANSSGSNASAGISLSESPYNFDKLSIQFGDNNGNVSIQEIPMESSPTQFALLVSHINNAATNVYLKNGRYSLSSSTLTRVSESQITFNGNTVSTVLATDNLKIYRVIGVHRIANN